jgi:hypothetical protein
MKATTMEATSTKTASMATAAAAASGSHRRQNQADCRNYKQGYERFPHHVSSTGTISVPRIRQSLQRDYSAIEERSLSTDREPRLIDREPRLIDHRPHKCLLGSSSDRTNRN